MQFLRCIYIYRERYVHFTLKTTHVCMYIHIRIYIYIYMYIYIYIYIWTTNCSHDTQWEDVVTRSENKADDFRECCLQKFTTSCKATLAHWAASTKDCGLILIWAALSSWAGSSCIYNNVHKKYVYIYK